MTVRILIADDEPLYLRTTGDLLRNEGYECVCVKDANSALQSLDKQHFDLVLSDLNMPGNLDLELLKEHNRRRKHIPLIVITGVPSLPSAIESVRLGISDYLLKPVRFETLLESVRRALDNAANIKTAASIPIRTRSELQAKFPTIVGCSPPIVEVLEIIDRVAGTDANILITGESGTGKEVIAKAIHEHSHRADGRFQVIDCTAIPEALFESTLFGHKKGAFTGAVGDQTGLLAQCDGGTVFFDELGELPLATQAKLLRVVQEQTFTPVGTHNSIAINTRYLCATNRDLQVDVAEGRFRQDLYYRLGVIHVHLPPLRDREEDVVLLANYFLDILTKGNSKSIEFAEATMEFFRAYPWPGNIRELRNAVERAVAFCRGGVIEPYDLPERILAGNFEKSPRLSHVTSWENGSASEAPTNVAGPANASWDDAIKAAESEYLKELMRNHAGNVSKAARYADISRQGLHKLLKSHGITAADYRPRI